MLKLKNKIMKRVVLTAALSVIMLASALPVSAKTCSYAYDSVMAIGYGNINIEKAAVNPYTYSAYVLGSEPLVVKNIAYYSVGDGGAYNNVQGRQIMQLGSVAPGTTRTTTKSSVTIMLYNNTTPKSSVTDSVS